MAATIINNLPEGFQTDFLREEESDVLPVIRREGGNLVFPALVRQETRQTDGVEKTIFRFFDVPVRFIGQDVSDYEKCKIQSYADLRKFFYGPATVQMEQQLKGTFAKHQYAVRLTFPKTTGKVPAAVTRFEEIKTAFWGVVDGVLSKLGKTRNDLPEQPFNAETMLAWAVENGLSAADIADASAAIMRISLDLLHNGRNWNELF